MERNPFLLTDAELFLGDDGAVAVDVFADKVIQQTATLTDEGFQRAGGDEVLVVLLQVLGEVFDTDGEESDLGFGAAGIILALAILLEDFLLLFV